MSFEQFSMFIRGELDVPEKRLFGPMSCNRHDGDGLHTGQVFIGGKRPACCMRAYKLPLLILLCYLYTPFGEGSGRGGCKAGQSFTDLFEVVICFLIADRGWQHPFVLLQDLFYCCM